ERLALLRIARRFVDTRPREPDRQGADRDAAFIEGGQELLVAVATLAENVLSRNAAVLEDQLARVRRVPADLPVLLRRPEAVVRDRHHDAGQFRLAVGLLTGPAEHGHEGRDVSTGVGDERLAPVDDPLA